MALKTFKPTSPGRRSLVIVDRGGLYKGKPEKSLTEGLSGKGGRNNAGRITARRRGGGHKRRYRRVDFKRRKFDVTATVERIEYDPNRSAVIALITYADGEKSYILAPQRLSVGDTVVSGERADIKPGNALPMQNIPVGTIIHNIELKAGAGGQLARSAGTYVQLIGKDQGYAQLRLTSGEIQAPVGPRRGDEPGGSPPRRRRRPLVGRPPSRNTVGRAHQGQTHPLEQEDRPPDHAAAQALGVEEWLVLSGRDRSSISTC